MPPYSHVAEKAPFTKAPVIVRTWRLPARTVSERSSSGPLKWPSPLIVSGPDWAVKEILGNVLLVDWMTQELVDRRSWGSAGNAVMNVAITTRTKRKDGFIPLNDGSNVESSVLRIYIDVTPSYRSQNSPRVLILLISLLVVILADTISPD